MNLKKLKKDIEKFYEEFDEDADNLYQEEYQFMIKGKYKRKLKYPESFYDHWKKKMEDFILKRCSLAQLNETEKRE